MISQMFINFTLKLVSMIALGFALYYSMKLRAKTEKTSPFWLFVCVSVSLLLVTAIADVFEFGSYILLGSGSLADNLAEIMDWFEMAALAAAASFLVSAGILLKYCHELYRILLGENKD